MDWRGTTCHHLPMGRRRRAREAREEGQQAEGGKKAVETGKELVPALSGSGAALGGAALLGPPGVLLGPVASVGVKRLIERIDRVFRSAADEFVARQLGPIEGARVARTYNRAVEVIIERLRDGEGLRDDGFFDRVREDERTAAADVLEGVLQKARDAYEQRKAERLGDLFAFIATRADISPSHANYLLELADRLTYIQLLLLGIFAQEDRSGLPDWTSTGSFTPQETGLVAAIEDLGRQELVLRDDNRAVSTFSDVNPRQLKTVLNGLLLHEGMGLHEAEEEDWEEVLNELRRLGTLDADEGEARLDMVVPRGEDPSITRVQIGHQVVSRTPPVVRLEAEESAGAEDSEPEEAQS